MEKFDLPSYNNSEQPTSTQPNPVDKPKEDLPYGVLEHVKKELDSPDSSSADELVAEKPVALERLMSWARKPASKRKLAFFGALTAILGGAGYLKRDQINASFQNAVVESPVLTDLEERWEARGSQISDNLAGQATSSEQVNDAGSKDVASGESPVAEFTINGLGFRVKEAPSKDEADMGPTIPMSSPYAENLMRPESQSLEAPQDQRKFDRLVNRELAAYLADAAGDNIEREERLSGFERGNVQSFLSAASYIVGHQLHYDQEVANGVDQGENGETVVSASAVKEMGSYSPDGMPVDQVMESGTQKGVVCRHLADAYMYTGESLRRLYPNQFQNIHITTIESIHRKHAWNVTYVVKGPRRMEVMVEDPTAFETHGQDPTYSLFRTLYYRNIISQESYLASCSEYFRAQKEYSHEDAGAFLSQALMWDSPEALDAVRGMLVRALDRNELLLRSHPGLDPDYSHKVAQSHGTDLVEVMDSPQYKESLELKDSREGIQFLQAYVGEYEEKSGKLLMQSYPLTQGELLRAKQAESAN